MNQIGCILSRLLKILKILTPPPPQIKYSLLWKTPENPENPENPAGSHYEPYAGVCILLNPENPTFKHTNEDFQDLPTHLVKKTYQSILKILKILKILQDFKLTALI